MVLLAGRKRLRVQSIAMPTRRWDSADGRPRWGVAGPVRLSAMRCMRGSSDGMPRALRRFEWATRLGLRAGERSSHAHDGAPLQIHGNERSDRGLNRAVYRCGLTHRDLASARSRAVQACAHDTRTARLGPSERLHHTAAVAQDAALERSDAPGCASAPRGVRQQPVSRRCAPAFGLLRGSRSTVVRATVRPGKAPAATLPRRCRRAWSTRRTARACLAGGRRAGRARGWSLASA